MPYIPQQSYTCNALCGRIRGDNLPTSSLTPGENLPRRIEHEDSATAVHHAEIPCLSHDGEINVSLECGDPTREYRLLNSGGGGEHSPAGLAVDGGWYGELGDLLVGRSGD